jgi:ketosteroid isomerase-like protein
MRYGLLIAFAGLFAGPLAAATPLAKFGWYADVVDACWVGTFPDGRTQHRHCYTAQFDQFIRGTATLSGDHQGTLTEQFWGDSVFAWNEAEKKITYYIWGSDGSHSRHEAWYEGEDLVFPVHSKTDPGTIAYRSLWRRVDDSTIEVQRQVPEGAPAALNWRTELTVVYHRQPSATEQATAARRAAFEAATDEFHQGLRTDDADGLFAFVADSVVMMPPGEPAVLGKSAMREWYAGFLSAFRTTSLTLADREVFLGDGWAVELGSFEWGLAPVAGGEPLLDRGSYLQVWSSQPDGQWRFEREIWNSALPAVLPAAK